MVCLSLSVIFARHIPEICCVQVAFKKQGKQRVSGLSWLQLQSIILAFFSRFLNIDYIQSEDCRILHQPPLLYRTESRLKQKVNQIHTNFNFEVFKSYFWRTCLVQIKNVFPEVD